MIVLAVVAVVTVLAGELVGVAVLVRGDEQGGGGGLKSERGYFKR